MISPHDFYSYTPPDRIIGLECEYNLQLGINPLTFTSYSVSDYLGIHAMNATNLRYAGEFFENGSRIYVDGGALEYATPGCLGPRQAVAADQAGILIMQAVAGASSLPHKGLYRLTGTTFNPDQKHVTAGYHENLLIPRQAMDSILIDALLPSFLASRIYAMSGTVRGDSYVFSQKVWGIGGNPISRSLNRGHDRRLAYGNKPMALITPPDRDATVAGSNRWARLEVRFADACISPTARYLGLAALSLVLRLIEHNRKLGKNRLLDLGLVTPVAASRLFASDLTLRKTAKTNGGNEFTALDIQEELLALMSELNEIIELPEDEQQVIEHLRKIIDQLRACDPEQAEYASLGDELDIAARHEFLTRNRHPEDVTARDPDVVAETLFWDKVYPNGGGMIWWSKHPSTFISDQDVQKLLTTPPYTRDAWRGDLIKKNARYIIGIDWRYVETELFTAIMNEPYLNT